MKVGVWYNSVEETLQNLGLPPNPTQYNPGFLVWETDGKMKTAWSEATRTRSPTAWCRRTRPARASE